jgi:cell division protein FtsW
VRTGFDAERISPARTGDPLFLASVFLLAGTGLAALYSASSGYAISLDKGPGYFAARQAFFLLPSLLAFWICALLPLERIRERIGAITLAGLAFLLLPFVPGLGESRNGATRWIDLGFTTFQPSEIWKPVSILYLAHIMDRRSERIERSSLALMPPLLICGLGCLIAFLQNDLSTAMVMGASAAAVFWIAGSPPSFFLGLGAAAAPLAALSVLTSDFRLRRILGFLFPAYEPHGQSYQVLGSIRAIGAGGLLGKGVGLGTLKVGSVPEVQSDFIFAAWAEETGFLGVLAFFGLWAFFAYRTFRRAFEEVDGFKSYLGFGLATLLMGQVLINVAVAAGALPATGMALPFFSAGGSCLVGSSAACGLLYNLSRAPAAGAHV